MILPQPTFRDIANTLPDLSQYQGLGPQSITPWLQLKDPLLQRTCAAGLALQYEFFFGKTPFTPAEQNAVSFGFIAVDPTIGAALSNISGFKHLSAEFTFGAAIVVSRGRIEGHQRLLRTIAIAGTVFPVVEITGTLQRQGVPPFPDSPPNAGSTACWARSRGTVPGATWHTGMITAGHVVSGMPLGTVISLVPSPLHALPSDATIVDVGQCPIDGAVLEMDSKDWPSTIAALTVSDPAITPIPAGASVTLSGRHTPGGTGTVLRVNQNPGYFGPMMAERVVFDTIGKPGDSGGLLSDGGHTGFGVYMGAFPSRLHGPKDGVAQGLWQITEWFGADVFI